MNILLDTHVLIWALENNPTLSDATRNSKVMASNMVFVSAVSIWEIGIKRSLGKLEVPDNLTEEIKSHRFTPLNITHFQSLTPPFLESSFSANVIPLHYKLNSSHVLFPIIKRGVKQGISHRQY